MLLMIVFNLRNMLSVDIVHKVISDSFYQWQSLKDKVTFNLRNMVSIVSCYH